MAGEGVKYLTADELLDDVIAEIRRRFRMTLTDFLQAVDLGEVVEWRCSDLMDLLIFLDETVVEP